MTARRTPGAPWARARAALLAAVVVAALAACVAVPQTGPVGAGVEGVNEPGAVMPLGEGPVPDASPQDIVQGFLSASAAGFNRDATGVTNNFRDAREFLSGAVQSSWKPRCR